MKKFLLVPPGHLPSSVTRKLTQLDQKMKDILERTDLGEHEKARLYSDTLERYLSLKRQIDQPRSVPLVEERQKSSSHLNLGILPRQYRPRAENLLTHLTENTNFAWNERGEVMSNGEPIPGSNVIDLIDDIIRPRNKPPPIGSAVFVNELKRSNIPMTLIGNKTRFNETFNSPDISHNLSQTSTPVNRKHRRTRSHLTSKWESLY